MAPAATPYNPDPNAFAAMYNSHLATLTFNSKPIITNLTVMARDNVHTMANTVARCIDEHITQVGAHDQLSLSGIPGLTRCRSPSQTPPPHRLPSLYLLDSISKNIGPPYTTLWSQRIAHLFLESYRIVDQPTKVRMEELLNTWRIGAPDGTPLFGGDAQWEIERNLYGSQGVPPHILKAQQRLSAPPNGVAATGSPFAQHGQASGSRSPMPHLHQQLSDDRRRTVEQIDRILAGGSLNPTKAAALRQLRTVVQSTTLSPQEMEQIQTQLTTLAGQSRDRSSTPSLAPNPVTATPPPPAPQPAVTGLPAGLSDALANLSKMTALGASASPQPPATVPAPSVAESGSNDLIKSLMAAGLLPAASTEQQASSSSSKGKQALQQDDEYTAAMLGLEVQMTSLDLHKELSPSALELLIPNASPRYPLPLRCRQCANRYPAGPAGQKSLDAHLDWHFRQGRRAKDSAARGLSRTWLDRAREWIRGGHDDPAAGGSGGLSGSKNAESGASGRGGLSAQQEAELASYSASWVVAPTDPKLANAPCPICKEKFSSEWSEDEEEWIWRNATKRTDGGVQVYYHGSCYYSAKVLSANVASRPTTTPPADGTGSSAASRRSASVAYRGRGSTPANPLERLKEEEIDGETTSPNASNDAATNSSRKRKENPIAAGEADDSGEAAVGQDGEPNKRLAQ